MSIFPLQLMVPAWIQPTRQLDKILDNSFVLSSTIRQWKDGICELGIRLFPDTLQGGGILILDFLTTKIVRDKLALFVSAIVFVIVTQTV